MFIGDQKLNVKLIPIQFEFHREVIAETLVRKHYLTDEARDQFEVIFKYKKSKANANDKKESMACDKKGNLLHGRYLFALMYFNNNFHLYAVPDNRIVRNHSHISSGKPVAGTGYLEFKEGKLVLFSNESGHYKPTAEQMYWALLYFLVQTRSSSLLFEVHSQNKKDPNKVDINRYFAKDIFKMLKKKDAMLSSEPLALFKGGNDAESNSRFLKHPKQWRAKEDVPTEANNNNNNSKFEESVSNYEEKLQLTNPLSLIDKSKSEQKSKSLDDSYDEEMESKNNAKVGADISIDNKLANLSL